MSEPTPDEPILKEMGGSDPLVMHDKACKNTSFNLDRLSALLGSWSQVGILIVIAVGYIYTVRPVFQHQLLQEQAAKLTMDKEAASAELNRTIEKQLEAKKELEIVNAALLSAQNERENLAVELGKTRASEKEFKARASKMQSQLNRSLEKAQWELLLIDFTWANFAADWNRDIERYNSNVKDEDFIKFEAAYWPDPYANLMAKIETVTEKNKISNEIPEKFIREVEEFIEVKKDYLVCDPPDIDGMAKEYMKDIENLKPIVDKELAEYIETIKKEHGSPFSRVEITDEFESSSRRSIFIGKKYSVDKKYTEEINKKRRGCEEKASIVMKEFRGIKGVTR